MQIVHSISELRSALPPLSAANRSFVPTMGNLHEGHLALLRHAKPLADICIASIFVNRLQFLPHEDFDSYPRTLERDADLLAQNGCDILFAPQETDLYPQKQTFTIRPPAELADILEGSFRPGFFTGVSTVVMKLFQCVQPQIAIFGKKDYQQLMVLQNMVQQFALPIHIEGLEIQRADDGLALSSRNGYLSNEERAQATLLIHSLRTLAQEYRTAATSNNAINALPALEAKAMETLHQAGWQPDYMTVRRRSDLAPPTASDNPATETLVALGAAKLGRTRLIDNFEF